MKSSRERGLRGRVLPALDGRSLFHPARIDWRSRRQRPAIDRAKRGTAACALLAAVKIERGSHHQHGEAREQRAVERQVVEVGKTGNERRASKVTRMIQPGYGSLPLIKLKISGPDGAGQ